MHDAVGVLVLLASKAFCHIVHFPATLFGYTCPIAADFLNNRVDVHGSALSIRRLKHEFLG